MLIDIDAFESGIGWIRAGSRALGVVLPCPVCIFEETEQANHLGVAIEANIIKQKQPVINGRIRELSFGKTDFHMYSEPASDHPIDLTRYQVLNCYSGRAGLINSGEASGDDGFVAAIKTAVINKRAGCMGVISGRKGFPTAHARGYRVTARYTGRLSIVRDHHCITGEDHDNYHEDICNEGHRRCGFYG